MAFSMKYKKGVDIKRVVSKLTITILTLYVGGTILSEVGSVMNGTTSPFYPGLELIGWTVSTTGQITATNGTGILTVVGLVGIASIVMEFVTVSF